MLGCTVLRAAAHRAWTNIGTVLLPGLPYLFAVLTGLGFGAAPLTSAAASEAKVGTLTHRLVIDAAKIAIEPAGAGGASDAVRVRYPGGMTAPAGAPDLPRVPVWIELPAGMRAAAVRGTPEGLRDLPSAVVAKAGAAKRSDGSRLEAIDSREVHDAAAWAELGAQGSFRGHRVASVLVTPVQWEEASGRLLTASAVAIEIELAPLLPEEVLAVVPRARIVREIEAKFDHAAGTKIERFTPLAATEVLLESAAGSGPAGPGPY